MRAALVIVACLASGLAVAAATERRGAPATLDECDALVRESPDDLGPYQCYWFVGRNQAKLELLRVSVDVNREFFRFK